MHAFPRHLPPANGAPTRPASTATSSAAPRDGALKINQVSRAFFEHNTGKSINTDAFITDMIRDEYPRLHLTVVPQYNIDFLGYAAAGHATVAPIDKEFERLRWTSYGESDPLGAGVQLTSAI